MSKHRALDAKEIIEQVIEQDKTFGPVHEALRTAAAVKVAELHKETEALREKARLYSMTRR